MCQGRGVGHTSMQSRILASTPMCPRTHIPSTHARAHMQVSRTHAHLTHTHTPINCLWQAQVGCHHCTALIAKRGSHNVSCHQTMLNSGAPRTRRAIDNTLPTDGKTPSLASGAVATLDAHAHTHLHKVNASNASVDACTHRDTNACKCVIQIVSDPPSAK